MTCDQAMETLDPQNWADMRSLAHRMVGDALGQLETLRERPVWQSIPPEARARLTTAAPWEPQGAEAAHDFVDSAQRTRWATSTHVSGAGTWEAAPCWAHWPTSWPRP